MAATSITLTDTGKRRVADSANESVKANSGSAITLRCTSITYSIKTNINDESVKKYVSNTDTNEFDFPEVHKGSLQVPVWTLKGILDMTVAGDQTLLGNMVQMCKTKGFKELGTSNDAANTIMIRYSEEGGGVTTKNVRVDSLNINQKPRSRKVTWTYILKETT